MQDFSPSLLNHSDVGFNSDFKYTALRRVVELEANGRSFQAKNSSHTKLLFANSKEQVLNKGLTKL